MKFSVLMRVVAFLIGVALLVLATSSIHRIVFEGRRYYEFESKDFGFWLDAIIVWGCVALGVFGAIGLSAVQDIKTLTGIKELVACGFYCVVAIVGSIILLDIVTSAAPHADPIDPMTKAMIVLGMIGLFASIDGRLFHVLGMESEQKTAAS